MCPPDSETGTYMTAAATPTMLNLTHTPVTPRPGSCVAPPTRPPAHLTIHMHRLQSPAQGGSDTNRCRQVACVMAAAIKITMHKQTWHRHPPARLYPSSRSLLDSRQARATRRCSCVRGLDTGAAAAAAAPAAAAAAAALGPALKAAGRSAAAVGGAAPADVEGCGSPPAAGGAPGSRPPASVEADKQGGGEWVSGRWSFVLSVELVGTGAGARHITGVCGCAHADTVTNTTDRTKVAAALDSPGALCVVAATP